MSEFGGGLGFPLALRDGYLFVLKVLSYGIRFSCPIFTFMVRVNEIN